MQFRKRLPSLAALVALEAAARHRSVTAAAKELGVTQAAVSRHIALLEEDFGRPLFERVHRAIEPTPWCKALSNSLADSFANIADAVDLARTSVADVVTIGATIAFSSLWLLPKLAELREAHPNVQIRVISQDGEFRMHTGEVDIAFWYGIPSAAGGTVLATHEERIYPVCSPAYAARRAIADFPRGALSLVETEERVKNWYRWSEWFAMAGLKGETYTPPLRFTYYPETIAAVRAGQGIALGWDTLVRQFIDDGSLVRIGEREVRPESTYNIVVPSSSRRSPACELVVEWLGDALRRS